MEYIGMVNVVFYKAKKKLKAKITIQCNIIKTYLILLFLKIKKAKNKNLKKETQNLYFLIQSL